MKKYFFLLLASISIGSFAAGSEHSNLHSDLEKIFNESKFNSGNLVSDHLGVYIGECIGKVTFQNGDVKYSRPLPVYMVFAHFMMPKTKKYELFPWNYRVLYWNKSVEEYVNEYFSSVFANTQTIIDGKPLYSRHEDVESVGIIDDSYVTKIGSVFHYKARFLGDDEKIVTQKNMITSFKAVDEQTLISKIEYEDYEMSKTPGQALVYCSWYKKVKKCSEIPMENRGGVDCSNSTN